MVLKAQLLGAAFLLPSRGSCLILETNRYKYKVSCYDPSLRLSCYELLKLGVTIYYVPRSPSKSHTFPVISFLSAIASPRTIARAVDRAIHYTVYTVSTISAVSFSITLLVIRKSYS